MKKILVTGGAGFIGSHLVEYLSRRNMVYVIDTLLHKNKLQNYNKNIKLIKGDVRDYDLVKYYSKNCNSIFHLAAILESTLFQKKILKQWIVNMKVLKTYVRQLKITK